jgi:hypothetical protein
MMPDTPKRELDEHNERLEQIQDEIDEARRTAQDDLVLPGHHERTFADPEGDGA